MTLRPDDTAPELNSETAHGQIVPQPPVHYRKEGIATFDAGPEKIFRYMSAGNHPHAAFKSHRLAGITDNVVTIGRDAADGNWPAGRDFGLSCHVRFDIFRVN